MVVEGNEAFRRSIVRFLKTDRIVGWDYFAGVDQKPDANGPPGQVKVLDGDPNTELARRLLGTGDAGGDGANVGQVRGAPGADQVAGGTAGRAAEPEAPRAQRPAETSARTIDGAPVGLWKAARSRTRRHRPPLSLRRQ